MLFLLREINNARWYPKSLALLSDRVLSRPTRHDELSIDGLSIKTPHRALTSGHRPHYLASSSNNTAHRDTMPVQQTLPSHRIVVKSIHGKPTKSAITTAIAIAIRVDIAFVAARWPARPEIQSIINVVEEDHRDHSRDRGGCNAPLPSYHARRSPLSSYHARRSHRASQGLDGGTPSPRRSRPSWI